MTRCSKCHGTGLVRDDGSNLGFCLCPLGAVVWQRSLERALGDVAQEVGAR